MRYGEVLRSIVLRVSIFSITDADVAETGVVFRLRECRSRAWALNLDLALEEDGIVSVEAQGGKVISSMASECQIILDPTRDDARHNREV